MYKSMKIFKFNRPFDRNLIEHHFIENRNPKKNPEIQTIIFFLFCWQIPEIQIKIQENQTKNPEIQTKISEIQK
jgi:hypothetical protein